MTTADEMALLLSRAALFSQLSPDDHRAIAREMRSAAFEPGQAIFARGDPARDIYLVIKGRVRLSILTSEGRELSFAHAERGAIFGEIATLDGGVRSADATAMTAVEAATLAKPAFFKLMAAKPLLAEAAIRFLCQRVREADHQLEAIALYPIEVRLARFFLAAARQKIGKKDEDRVEIDLEMSQTELAMLIGASRPKVNAALALLEDSGAIERNGTRIACDLEELEASAQFEA